MHQFQEALSRAGGAQLINDPAGDSTAAVHGNANGSLMAGYGYAGILVAFIARQNPLAIIPVAMLLVHDPLQRTLSAGRLLQDLYGLTNAEAQLVEALSTGMTAVAYARNRRISITTVYTHLRRTREKTGWKSVAELTRRFHELNVALRPN